MNNLKITLDNKRPQSMNSNAKFEAQNRIQQRPALQLNNNSDQIDQELIRTFTG